jgi:hypothetical protein
MSSALGQAYDLFHQKIDQNSLYATGGRSITRQQESADPTLEEMIDMRGTRLESGEEIAIAVTGNRSGPGTDARHVLNPAAVLAELNSIAARTANGDRMRVSPIPHSWRRLAAQRGPIAYVNGGTLVLATSPQAIYNVIVAAVRQQRLCRPAFYASIAQAYSKGAGHCLQRTRNGVFGCAAVTRGGLSA